MRNIVLVCLDAVRKDFFDEYAKRLHSRPGIEYTQARAVSGWSVPSHASMFTGTLPHEHGIHTFNRDFSALTREETFLSELPEHETLGASANVYASDAFGFNELFDAYRSVSPDRRFPDGLDAERWGQDADETGIARYLAFLRSALAHDYPIQSVANGILVEIDDWLADIPFEKPLDDGANIVAREAKTLVSAASEPFVLFTNFMDVHGPLTPVRAYDNSLYDAPPSWSSGAFDGRAVEHGDIDLIRDDIKHHRDLYAAATEYLDRVVTDLIDWTQVNTNKETTIVVTADHGENLGYEADRRLFAHRSGLTEGLLHVPLLVLNPPGETAQTDDYVSHLRLGELLTGLANGTVPDVTDDVIPAERIGFNVPVNPNATSLRDADRAIRVAYEDNTKYQWDSLGNRRRYRLNPDRPSWQELDSETVEIGEYETSLFNTPINEYRTSAQTSTEDKIPAVDDNVAERLSNLGYR